MGMLSTEKMEKISVNDIQKIKTSLDAPDFIICIPGAVNLAQFMNLDVTFLLWVYTVS